MKGKNGRAALRVLERQTEAPEIEELVSLELRPADSPMWPTQPVIWLQPEWKPGLTSPSGLNIERYHKTPVPGLMDVSVAAPELPMQPELDPPRERPVTPRLAPLESDLTPAGWDPRSETTR